MGGPERIKNRTLMGKDEQGKPVFVPPNFRVNVDEDVGECRGCGKVEELGDGLCMKCWDRKSGKMDGLTSG